MSCFTLILTTCLLKLQTSCVYDLQGEEKSDADSSSDSENGFYCLSKLYMCKTGCNITNFATECLGDKIVVFGGKSENDTIKACNVNDCLSTDKDITWYTIGALENPATNLAATRFKFKKTPNDAQNDSGAVSYSQGQLFMVQQFC